MLVRKTPRSWAIRIGGDPQSTGRSFDARINEVAIFNYALTPTQVQTLNQGFGPVSLDIQRVGDNVVLTRERGTLLEANAVTGHWFTNNVSSPFTNAPTRAQKFYQVIVK